MKVQPPNTPKTQREVILADLYPQLSPEELKEAEENLGRYVELVLQVYERIRLEPEAYARFRALTGSLARRRMDGKGRSASITTSA